MEPGHSEINWCSKRRAIDAALREEPSGLSPMDGRRCAGSAETEAGMIGDSFEQSGLCGVIAVCQDAEQPTMAL